MTTNSQRQSPTNSTKLKSNLIYNIGQRKSANCQLTLVVIIESAMASAPTKHKQHKPTTSGSRGVHVVSTLPHDSTLHYTLEELQSLST